MRRIRFGRSHEPVNQLLTANDGLQMLQAQGTGCGGRIVTARRAVRFHMHKGKGMVREVFRTRNMRDLIGNAGIAHVRYPTRTTPAAARRRSLSTSARRSASFWQTTATSPTLPNFMKTCNKHLRHVNTSSDSEVMLNVFAHELRREVSKNADPHRLNADNIFNAVAEVHRLVRGAYGVVAMIAGYGMLAFSRPLRHPPAGIGFANRQRRQKIPCRRLRIRRLQRAYLRFERDIRQGEAVFVGFDGTMIARQCSDRAKLSSNALLNKFTFQPRLCD